MVLYVYLTITYRLFWMVIFFFNDTATTEIYTLSLHDALPISRKGLFVLEGEPGSGFDVTCRAFAGDPVEYAMRDPRSGRRSEEHTSELQSRQYLVCRLLLEKKKKIKSGVNTYYM